jgi:nitroreductase
MINRIVSALKETHLGTRIYLALEQIIQIWWGVQILARDVWRFVYWSSAFRRNYSQRSLEARIIIAAHKIEKGFSLPTVKPVFGVAAVYELTDLLKLYQARQYPQDATGYKMASGALSTYLQEFETEEKKEIFEKIRDVLPAKNVEPAATKKVQKIGMKKGVDFSTLASTRTSIRNFSVEPVEITQIQEAVQIARNTPSVCNRQGWRVHAVDDPVNKEKILNLQGGNRGFTHTIPWVLIVTADLASCATVRERHEAYVDGGLFSMSLIYAFQSLGLGTCALNWCQKASKEPKIRRLVELTPSEEIIMLIAVGRIPENIEVARAEKRPLKEIFYYHVRKFNN